MPYIKWGLIIIIAIIAILVIFFPSTERRQAFASEKVTYLQQQLKAAEYDLCVIDIKASNKILADHYSGKKKLSAPKLGYHQTISEKACIDPSPTKQTTKQSDLFYIFKDEGVYITQTDRQHFANNGYLATDIATGGRYLEVYAPSWDGIDLDGNYWEEDREYTVKIVHNYGTMGLTVELAWKENGVPMNWAVGHMKEIWVDDGDVITTGQKFGSSGGCVGDLQEQEVSTGCHIHIEVWKDGVVIPYPTYTASPHGENLEALKKFRAQVYVDIDPYLSKYAASNVKEAGDVFRSAANGIKPEVLVCIAMADSTLGKYTRTANNIGNVGNTETSSWTPSSLEEGIHAISGVLNNQYLGDYTTVGQLSPGGGGTGKIYASSKYNWNSNILTCLSEIRGETVNESFNFRV